MRMSSACRGFNSCILEILCRRKFKLQLPAHVALLLWKPLDVFYKYQLTRVLVQATISQQREMIMMGSVYVAKTTLTIVCHPVIQGITELGLVCISPWVHGHPDKSWWTNGKSWVSVLNVSFMSLLHKMQGRVLLLGYTATVTFVKSQLISKTSSSSYIEKSNKRLGAINTP